MGRRKKDRKLGVASEGARYDLPLEKSAGTYFLMLLIALMSFLAILTLSGVLVLNHMTSQWSSGLQNRATIEIPASSPEGHLRNNTERSMLRDKTTTALENNTNLLTVEVLSDEDVHELVSPWLGNTIPEGSIPLPQLISVEVKDSSSTEIQKIETALKTVSDDITLDTHEGWLEDILRLAGSLKLSGGLITLVVGLTTIIAIAGAVRSRMAEHKADVELLHLMGASNDYISRQFQRHILIISFKGSLIGFGAGIVAIMIFSFLSASAHNTLMPKFPFSLFEFFILALLPACACIIAFTTARFTVLRTLSLMP